MHPQAREQIGFALTWTERCDGVDLLVRRGEDEVGEVDVGVWEAKWDNEGKIAMLDSGGGELARKRRYPDGVVNSISVPRKL